MGILSDWWIFDPRENLFTKVSLVGNDGETRNLLFVRIIEVRQVKLLVKRVVSVIGYVDGKKEVKREVVMHQIEEDEVGKTFLMRHIKSVNF